MEHTRQDNVINDIKEARKLLMGLEVIFLVKKQRELDINFVKRKLSIIL